MLASLSDIILACDTTQGACSVALVQDGTPLAVQVEPMERGHAEALVPMLDHVIQESGLAKVQITRLAVTIGPGTFTGVRLGLAAMRAFAIARSLPLVGVSTFWAMARGDLSTLPVTVCVAARSGVFYMQNFNPAHTLTVDPTGAAGPAPPHIVTEAGLAEFCPQTEFSVVGSGSDAVCARLSQARKSSAASWPDILHVADYARGAPLLDQLPEPIYLRPPDATLPDTSRQLERQAEG